MFNTFVKKKQARWIIQLYKSTTIHNLRGGVIKTVEKIWGKFSISVYQGSLGWGRIDHLGQTSSKGLVGKAKSSIFILSLKGCWIYKPCNLELLEFLLSQPL